MSEYDHLVEILDETPFWSALFGAMLLEESPLFPGITVLDVGCGMGFPLIELAERCRASGRVIGLDPWQAALEQARKKAERRGLTNVELLHGSAESIPLPDRSVDLVTMNLVLNNLAEPETALSEVARVLRQGGSLALTTNLRGHFAEFYTALLQVASPDIAARLRAERAKRGTKLKVEKLLAQAGFHVRKTRVWRTAYHFADAASLLNHTLLAIGFVPGWRAAIGAGADALLQQAGARLFQSGNGARLSVECLLVVADRQDTARRART